jgi:hypothetical protein
MDFAHHGALPPAKMPMMATIIGPFELFSVSDMVDLAVVAEALSVDSPAHRCVAGHANSLTPARLPNDHRCHNDSRDLRSRCDKVDATTVLTDLQRGYESGGVSEHQLHEGFRGLYEDAVGNARYLERWVQAYPNSYAALTARGAYYYRMGAFLRGGDFIAETPRLKIWAMHNSLALARPDLRAPLPVLELAATSGEPASDEALIGYARSA